MFRIVIRFVSLSYFFGLFDALSQLKNYNINKGKFYENEKVANNFYVNIGADGYS